MYQGYQWNFHSFINQPIIIFNIWHLSTKEKKDLAIELIEQGILTREIANQAHLSLSTIAKIRKELEGDTSEKISKTKSTQAQAFKLFEKNKTPVQVAIKLDIYCLTAM